MNDKEEKLYDLLTSKSFDELSNDEQAFVLSSLGSEEAYAKMREANLAAMEALAEDEELPAGLKSSVMEAFDKREDKKRGIVWWKYAAAVAILAIGAFVFWPAGNPERVQIAENVEREKSSTEADIQNETEDEESTPLKNEDAEAGTPKIQEKNLSSKAEQTIVEDELISEEVADEEERTDEIEVAREEEIDAPQIAKDGEMDNAEISEEEFEEQSFDPAKSLEDEAAPPEQPAVVQSFSADKARPQNAVSLSESISSKRSMNQELKQSGGISLSQIGGPFPKAYVAY